MAKTFTRADFLRFKQAPKAPIPTPPGGDNLDKYTGEWTFETAAHLLRRATFGASLQQMRDAANSDLDSIINQLFEELPLPDEPINFILEDDPFVPIGESWVNQPYVGRDADPDFAQQQQITRRRSLRAWIMQAIFKSGINIREKMTLFWHNHFVIQSSIIQDPNFVYNYIHTIRQNALGNFKDFVGKITIDPAMLRYLNGNQNNQNAPNENYARELFELFTIGKGELAGPNDYTTFTEDDVVAAAKVLTGWRDDGYGGRNGGVASSRFVGPLHDRSNKEFSHRFNNTVISNQLETEYLALIDMIFEQEEVSRFICRKLYRWFVYYDINEEVEANIIEPMAEIMRNNNYDIVEPLKVLLSSNHFFNICNIGPMIKNPIDFFSQMFVHHEVGFPQNPLLEYRIHNRLTSVFESLEMIYFEPPNVAGWKPYYQEPQFYRIWINSVTLASRQNITNLLMSGDVNIGDFNLTIDPLAYIENFDNPYDPNALIHEIARYIFPNGITETQKDFLKEILIPGLPDFEWTVEYSDYVGDPEDEDKKRGVETKLRSLFSAFFSMPEYYLS